RGMRYPKERETFIDPARVVCLQDLKLHSKGGLIGFTRKPIAAALGTVSCSSSNCLGNRLLAKKLTPVIFPPGRLRLATSPTLMGSAPITKTIGTVVLAAFAARVTGVAPVRITAALRWIKSAISAGSRL